MPKQVRYAPQRKYWTLERVLEGLRAFAQDTGLTPTSTSKYGAMVPQQPRGSWRQSPARYPSPSTILKHFSTIEEAWQSCGFQVTAYLSRWKPAEDAYLQAEAGKSTPTELAAQLGRSPSAVIQRMHALGLSSTVVAGVTIELLRRWSGLSRYLIMQAIRKGQLGAYTQSRFIYLNPGDLPNLPGLRLESLPETAHMLINQALEEREKRLQQFGDANYGSPYRYDGGVCVVHAHILHELPAGHLDRTGKRYGQLVVKRLKNVNLATKSIFWICQCDCGRPRTVEARGLANGRNGITTCLTCTSAKRLQGMTSKKRLYHFTPEIDDKLRAIYAQRRSRSSDDLQGLPDLIAETQFPDWALKKRAQELGLTRIKESAWSEQENAIVRKWAHLVPDRIALKLKEAGFTRTPTACNIHRKRLVLNMFNHGHYSANAIAHGFGIDQHAVVMWIREGKLQAERKGTKRITNKQGGDAYLVSRAAVRAFVFANPMSFDLGKVDQLWFMHVVSDGQVEMTRKVAKRGKRPESLHE